MNLILFIALIVLLIGLFIYYWKNIYIIWYNKKVIWDSIFDYKPKKVIKCTKGMIGNNHSKIVRFSDVDKYPEFKNATPIKINLQKGDVLFIPDRWWHWVFSKDNMRNISMSVIQKRIKLNPDNNTLDLELYDINKEQVLDYKIKNKPFLLKKKLKVKCLDLWENEKYIFDKCKNDKFKVLKNNCDCLIPIEGKVGNSQWEYMTFKDFSVKSNNNNNKYKYYLGCNDRVKEKHTSIQFP